MQGRRESTPSAFHPGRNRLSVPLKDRVRKPWMPRATNPTKRGREKEEKKDASKIRQLGSRRVWGGEEHELSAESLSTKKMNRYVASMQTRKRTNRGFYWKVRRGSSCLRRPMVDPKGRGRGRDTRKHHGSLHTSRGAKESGGGKGGGFGQRSRLPWYMRWRD